MAFFALFFIQVASQTASALFFNKVLARHGVGCEKENEREARLRHSLWKNSRNCGPGSDPIPALPQRGGGKLNDLFSA